MSVREATEPGASAERPLKLLHLDSGRELRGGQKQVLLLLKGLCARGHEVLLHCRQGALADEASEAGIAIRAFTSRAWDGMQLGALMKEMSPHIVHCHDARTHSRARFTQALTSLFDEGTQLVVHRRVSFPIPDRFAQRWKYREGVDAYIAVSRPVATQLEKAGIKSERIHVVPSCFDRKAFDRDLKAPLPEGVFSPDADELVISCVGALEKEKGQELLIRALPALTQKHPTVKVYFLGEGEQRVQLEQLAASLGVERRCCFCGHVAVVAPVLRRSRCVVVPTLSEGFPLVALEAMAAGSAVVASAVEVFAALIEDGKNGLLFPPGDSERLTSSISQVLTDPALCERFKQNASGLLDRYTPERMIEGTLAVYRQLLKLTS